jgi:hypothetical protein
VIDSFISTVTIKDSTFYNLKAEGDVFKITSSTVDMEGVLMYNVTSSDGTPVIGVSFESELSISGLIFRNSALGLISSLSSYTILNLIEVYDVIANRFIMQIDGNLDFVLKNSKFYNVSKFEN